MTSKNTPKEYTITTNEKDGCIAIELIISKKQAQAMTKSFWKSFSKNMKIRGFRPGKIPMSVAKKRKIPIEDMIGEVYSQYANIKFAETTPRKVILTSDHVVSGTNIKFNAWLEPDTQITTNDVDRILSDTHEMPTFDIDKYVDGRINSFTKMHPYLRNKEDEKGNPLPAQENNTVEVSINCMVDGVPYPDGCESATRIRLIRDHVHPESLYEKLIGVLPNDSFTIETNDIPPSWGSKLAGKQMRLDVKVIRVYSCEEAEINEDMAISAGFKNMEEWKRTLKDSVTRQATAQYEIVKRQLILSSILKTAVVGDFPDRWLDEKVKELKSDSNPDPRGRIHEVAKQIVALKKVGQLLNIEYDDADKVNVMRDDAVYAQKVLSVLIQKAKFEYVDSIPSKVVDGDKPVTTQEQPA